MDVEAVRGGGIRGTRLLKRVFVGRPRPTRELEDTLLSKFLALPIFSSDPISSVAYASEAAMVVLVGVSASALHLVFPLSIVIAILLGIVALSYTQVVRAYETSGGAYVVAKDNFGTVPALVAGAALLVDYVLTVSVSVAGGVFAVTSAVPVLASWNVKLCVLAIVLITFVNLRGVRESGIAFAPPLGFIVAMLVLIVVGLVRCIAELPAACGASRTRSRRAPGAVGACRPLCTHLPLDRARLREWRQSANEITRSTSPVRQMRRRHC